MHSFTDDKIERRRKSSYLRTRPLPCDTEDAGENEKLMFQVWKTPAPNNKNTGRWRYFPDTTGPNISKWRQSTSGLSPYVEINIQRADFSENFLEKE